MSIPKDPVILLSYINTHLRDTYFSLDDLCSSLDIDKNNLEQTLEAISYQYDANTNQFV